MNTNEQSQAMVTLPQSYIDACVESLELAIDYMKIVDTHNVPMWQQKLSSDTDVVSKLAALMRLYSSLNPTD